MVRTFHAQGGVATPSLIAYLQSNPGKWAHSLLGQCYSMPEEIRTALLSGEAEWKIPNEKTLTITLVESQ